MEKDEVTIREIIDTEKLIIGTLKTMLESGASSCRECDEHALIYHKSVLALAERFNEDGEI